ncbi:hypothetical protein GCM10017744_094870 [Streptomyces antimycoticus]
MRWRPGRQRAHRDAPFQEAAQDEEATEHTRARGHPVRGPVPHQMADDPAVGPDRQGSHRRPRAEPEPGDDGHRRPPERGGCAVQQIHGGLPRSGEGHPEDAVGATREIVREPGRSRMRRSRVPARRPVSHSRLIR